MKKKNFFLGISPRGGNRTLEHREKLNIFQLRYMTTYKVNY